MQLSVVDFMVGLDNAVIFQETDCLKCHGLGFEPIGCCSGFECGCQGRVVDFYPCDCDAEKPTDEQIKKWADDSRAEASE